MSKIRGVLGVVSGLVAASCVAVAGEFVWIEGESAAATANAKVNATGWGNKEYLSQESWLHYSVAADKVEKEVPEEGVLLKYPFEVKEAGDFQVWGRVGMEFIRTPIEWRIDNGEWKTNTADDLTCDLQVIDVWCEVAWVQFGNSKLTAGKHTLDIRLAKKKLEDGKFDKIVFALDVICLSKDAFQPNSKFKPGENYRDEQDEAATKNVFKLEEAEVPGARAEVKLNGLWEIAREDEQAPGVVEAPMEAPKQTLLFRGIPVPSNKNKTRPDLMYAHRLWYKTKIEVPASLADRSFFIDFPMNSLITTVYMNGQLCGSNATPHAPFRIDVSKAVKPGQVNELLVGIKDAWYGRAADPDRPEKLRKAFNLPEKYFGIGFQNLDYPVWHLTNSGILCTPTFSAGGAAYTDDVFIQTSVAKKAIAVDVTIANPTGKALDGEVLLEAVDYKTGDVANTFPAATFKVAAGASETLKLSNAWAAPKLWWPDTPNLYILRTTVKIAGKPADIIHTTFGFREWTSEGVKFVLNGVAWPMWADIAALAGGTAESVLDIYKRSKNRTYRLSVAGQCSTGPGIWKDDIESYDAFDFMDRNGVVIRFNASTLDGEAIGYDFSEKDPITIEKQGGSKMKKNLLKNWMAQTLGMVKAVRNHPSLHIYTIENEFAYINLVNLAGRTPLMDEYEDEITKISDAVIALDPTRPVMIDGGGALKKNTLPVCGDHYVSTLDTRYPDLGYEAFPEGGGRNRWLWDQKRPRFAGEDFFATGMEPGDFAAWGGEKAFGGKAVLAESYAICYRMLTEGYRWGEFMYGIHYWIGGQGGDPQWVSNADRAVFTRDWNWTFGSGETVKRLFGIFNSTQYPEPISFTRTLMLGDKEFSTKTTSHKVAPGTSEKFDESLAMPTVKERTEAELVLTLKVGDTEVFRDTKAVSILPPPALVAPVAAGQVVVFDPENKVTPWLKKALSVTPIPSLDKIPAAAKVVIVAPDAITEDATTSTTLAAAAVPGRAIIVLDQTNPLKYQALPAAIRMATGLAADGSTGFIEDSTHPVFAGLESKDFFTWGHGRTLYRNTYEKPTSNGKSLLQVGRRLANSALVEIPVGKGILYLSQLNIAETLADNAVAQQLLLNLISTGAAYKQEIRSVAVCSKNANLLKALGNIGLEFKAVETPLAAIEDATRSIAIVSATPENLATLAGSMDKVKAFWSRGGTIFFNGLDKAGLADYNKIVGFNHIIRDFQRERIGFPEVRSPLVAGLSVGDLVMLSGERIFRWLASEYVSSDVFTSVIDYDDIAPFSKSDYGSYGQIINGFIGADGWRLIVDGPIPNEGKGPFSMKITLPQVETVREVIYDQSVNYCPTVKLAIEFDGANRQEFSIPSEGEAETLTVTPAQKAKELTIHATEWIENPNKPGNTTFGIDNIWIKVERSKEFLDTVRPLTVPAGMMQYDKEGKGGVVLCNLKFQDNEPVPVNVKKKQSALSALLRNLKAPFAGAKTVVVGTALRYEPLDIHTKATAYKDEKGWFKKDRTFVGLPEGRNTFAGIEYDIYEMPTSPVPQTLMLKGKGAPGNNKELSAEIRDIPVGKKADALFFLHTSNMAGRRNEKDIKEDKKYEMFKYIVNYADGQKAEIPVFSEFEIENYLQQKTAQAIPGAQVAWTMPYEGSEDIAVAYSMQWNNPRPEVEIKSIDMVITDANRGTPVLLALTAATTEK